MNFHAINCIKTCQREHVNILSQHFLHAKCRVNNFEQLYFELLRGGWETGKEPSRDIVKVCFKFEIQMWGKWKRAKVIINRLS